MGEVVIELSKRTQYECRTVSTGIADGRESAGSSVELRCPQEAPIPVSFGIERKCVEVSPWEGLLVDRGSSLRISLWAGWSG